MAGISTLNFMVKFGHCDVAGIAYFPRIFDWFHQGMENWVEHELGVPYAAFIQKKKCGLPAVKTEAEFVGPCVLGDHLQIQTSVSRLGTCSLDLRYRIIEPITQSLRVTGRTTVVMVDLDSISDNYMSPIPIPQEMRERIVQFGIEPTSSS